jgi:hypothetical protein
VAIERREVPAQFAQIEELMYASQQVILRNVIVEIEGVEQSILVATLLSHHLEALR